MTPLLFALVAVAGGVGAGCRLLVDRGVNSRVTRGLPLGTLVVNVTGSLALGFATGLALTGLLPAEWAIVVGSGFLGGYTTFSTASYEAVRLIMAKRHRDALIASLGMLVATTGAAAIGLLLGSLF